MYTCKVLTSEDASNPSCAPKTEDVIEREREEIRLGMTEKRDKSLDTVGNKCYMGHKQDYYCLC